MGELTLALADKAGLKWAQDTVTANHYIHRPVDVRCSPTAYLVLLNGERVGCLIFGRPEATRVNGWYGSVADKLAGRCTLTRWEICSTPKKRRVSMNSSLLTPGRTNGAATR